jgi:cyanocobalamin reductase (cyanide-eliminating) / alkylcobalamin dealkylase
MSNAGWKELARSFSAALERYGLDIAHSFRVDAFNQSATGLDVLPDFGRHNALAVLVGNTGALWQPFKAALERETEDSAERGSEHETERARLVASSNPVDDYVERNVAKAVPEGAPQHTILHAYVMEPAPIPIQRIAESAGLAVISPSHLSIHRVFGPWFALRAVVIFDIEGPAAFPGPLSNPCEPCARPCLHALTTALETDGDGRERVDLTSDNWRRWLAVRDACPEGRSYRYGPEQIRYHYTKDLRRIRPGELSRKSRR